VLDPFMGGGTTVVEALSLGRKAVGVDLNPLGHFVATVKTTPLTRGDEVLIKAWLEDVQDAKRRRIAIANPPVRNLPRNAQQQLADLATQGDWLPLERQRRFVRCALLRTGQWAIDRDRPVATGREILEHFAATLIQMLDSMGEFVQFKPAAEAAFTNTTLSNNGP